MLSNWSQEPSSGLTSGPPLWGQPLPGQRSPSVLENMRTQVEHEQYSIWIITNFAVSVLIGLVFVLENEAMVVLV